MKKLEEYARRAGEEFFASSRAETPLEREERRARASRYVSLRDERQRWLKSKGQCR